MTDYEAILGDSHSCRVCNKHIRTWDQPNFGIVYVCAACFPKTPAEAQAPRDRIEWEPKLPKSNVAATHELHTQYDLASLGGM